MEMFAEFFVKGGPFMYGLLLAGLTHMGLVVLQLVLVKKIDLMPLLWAGLFGLPIFGGLGSVSGMIQAFKAVGAASPEMKQALLASGFSIALYTTELGLILVGIGAFFTGVAGVVVRWMRRPRPEPVS